ncbi:aminotransferase-like domain-containing protein [Hydrogenophaga sp.]|uniref:aminotransferase-like domain-containing protein n=1 Tax=Hydrogenophaga sp. TaxID=1904254 RepID=UPI002FCC36B4
MQNRPPFSDADASPDTKVEALVKRIALAIDHGQVPAGTRLRSVRDCADKEGVSRNTVVEAYNRLIARGYAESRPGSGYYARKATGSRAQAPAAHLSEAVDVVSLLREQLEQHYEVRVGDGRPPATWMEGSELGRHLRGVRSNTWNQLEHGYGTPWGYLPLRQTIARLLHERSIQADARQVLLTQGANHALDLIVRQLLRPGDVVLVDSPGYYPLFGKLKLAEVTMVGVPRLPDGPDLEALHVLAAAHRPKVFFTQSLAHNPTGGSLSLAKAHRLLQLAAQHDIQIVEDDPFADLMPASAPRLSALDQLDRVIYVSSFSKTLSAGLRVGFMAGPSAIINDLCDLKMVTLVSTSDFVERVVSQLIDSGQYRRHLARLKARLHVAQRLSLPAMERAGLRLLSAYTGGYYVWAELPGGETEIDLVRRAAAEGIFVSPGSVFFPDRHSARPCMRVNIAYASDERFLRLFQTG